MQNDKFIATIQFFQNFIGLITFSKSRIIISKTTTKDKGENLSTFSPDENLNKLDDLTPVSAQTRLTPSQEELARSKIKKDVDFFIETDSLSEINEYLSAGYILDRGQLKTIFTKKSNWLTIEVEPLSVVEKEETEAKEEQKELANNPSITNISREQKEFFKQHIESVYLPGIQDLIIEGIIAFQEKSESQKKTDSFSFDGIRPHVLHNLRFHDVLYAVEKFQLSTTLLALYSNHFNNDALIFKTYQEESMTLRQFFKRTKSDFEKHGAEKLARQANYGQVFERFSTSFSFLENYTNTNFSDLKKLAFKEKISTIQQLYRPSAHANSMIGELQSNLNENILGFQKSSIPIEAWNKIDSIKKHGAELQTVMDKLSPEDQFQVKNLTQKVLMSTISEYMVISPSHKASLKNDAGQGLDELFLESLSNIETTLSQKLQLVAEAQFKDVKTTHQYLKAHR